MTEELSDYWNGGEAFWFIGGEKCPNCDYPIISNGNAHSCTVCDWWRKVEQ